MKKYWKTVVYATLALLVLISGTGMTTYVHTCHMMARTDVGLSPKKCCGEKARILVGDQFSTKCCEHDSHVNRTVQFSPVDLKFDFQPDFSLTQALFSFQFLPENTRSSEGFRFPRPPDPGGRVLLNLFQVYRI